MDFGLESVSLTLAVGALAVLIIFMNTSFHLEFWNKLKKTCNDQRGNQFLHFMLIVFFALIFSLGVLFENLHPRIFNSDTNKDWSWLQHCLFPKHKEDLRVDCILGSSALKVDDKNRIKCANNNLTHQALGLEIVNRSTPPTTYTISGETIELVVDTNSDEKLKSKCLVKNGVLALYYEAKNRVFKEPTYFSELSKLEDRYQFSGAVSLLGLAGFFITILSSMFAWYSNHKKKYTSRNNVWIRVVACLILTVWMYCFGSLSYDHDRTQFTKRVIGYMEAIENSETNLAGEN